MNHRCLLLLLWAAGPSLAGTDYAREFERLGDERNKAVKEALEPIDRRYQADLESLLKRATQAGDLNTAVIVKKALDQLTGGRPLKPQLVVSAPKELLGLWEFSDGHAIQTREFRPDGSVLGGPGGGHWAIEGDELKIAYGNVVDTLEFPPKNGRMVGRNSHGDGLTLTKKRTK